MQDRGYLTDVWRFFKPVVLIDLGVLALVWLLMLLSGWSMQGYANALRWSGVIILAAGALAFTGGSDISKYGNSISNFKDIEAIRKHKGGGFLTVGGDMRRMLHMLLAGVIPIVISFLI